MNKEYLGSYRIIDRLGVGGTAEVFLALDTDKNKQLALKCHRSEEIELNQFRNLINREYELINGLNYPGIVQLYDLDSGDVNPFLAMEYISGRSLDQIGRIEDINALLNIISSISINLYYCKLAGISHGDFKPHNIYLTGDVRSYSNARLFYSKISDFSLGLKNSEDPEKRIGLGTIGYAAPETIGDKILNHRSDIFSLGIISYQLATGINPFIMDETDPVQINARIKELQPDNPIRLESSIPEDLGNLILNMLEKDPYKRPNDAYIICKELEKAGARYPYRKAIRPKHLMPVFDNPNDIIASDAECVNFNRLTRDRLYEYAGTCKNELRSILEINFNKNIICWEDGYLVNEGGPDDLIWPSRLQVRNKRRFHALPYSARKKHTLSAIVGNTGDALKLDVISVDDVEKIREPHLYYLKQNLSEITIRRFSNILARRALIEKKDNLLASRLYIQAENYNDSFNSVIDAANELINDNQNISAIALLQSYERLCRCEDDINRHARILMKIGDTQKAIGEPDEAEKTYQSIITIYKDHPADKILAETYKDLGDVYKAKRDFDQGIESLKKAEQLYLELGDDLELSHTMNNLGNIYTINSQFKKALKEFRSALKLQHRLNSFHDIASTLNNIAAIYFYRRRYSWTLRFFELALKLQREIGNAGEIARTLNNLGFIHNEMNANDEAIDCLSESLQLNKMIGSKSEMLFNYGNLTMVLMSAGKLRESTEHIKQGLALARELDNKPHLATLYSTLGAVQKRMGLYGQALENFKLVLELLKETNDDFLYIYCHVEMAEIYHRIGLDDKAIDTLDLIQGTIVKLEDKNSHIIEGLIRGEIRNDMKIVDEAIKTALQIKADRYLKIAYLRLCRMYIKNREWDKFKGIMENLSETYLGEKSDIEKSTYFNQYGEYYLNHSDLQNAEQYYVMAKEHASSSNLTPELITAQVGLARIYIESRDFEKGYKYYKLAADALKIIANDITDPEYKKVFLQSSEVQQILQGIRDLNQIMAGQKKADP